LGEFPFKAECRASLLKKRFFTDSAILKVSANSQEGRDQKVEGGGTPEMPK